MDYNGVNQAWQANYCYQQNNMDSEDPLYLCTEKLSINKEEFDYMFDDSTPVKACGDLAYHMNSDDNINKKLEQQREPSSQFKRRRLLFDNEMLDSPNCNEQIPQIASFYYKPQTSSVLKLNQREESTQELLAESSEWINAFADLSASSYEGLDESSEGWLSQCLNDPEMHFSPENMNNLEASNVQIDVSDFWNDAPVSEANVVQKRIVRTPKNVIVKGRRPLIMTPTKLASSIAYPFTIIKPCGFHGDVTLKDINRRIHTPPPSNSNQSDESLYPTSAFSGKPVVGKTKIRTEGGKGSITIMRTKG